MEREKRRHYNQTGNSVGLMLLLLLLLLVLLSNYNQRKDGNDIMMLWKKAYGEDQGEQKKIGRELWRNFVETS